ncbi:MAG: SDR family oxidoreductase [Armatimonadota bacterium]|nr:SDR family oxidoreductase [Armatimonadota bacterium]
MLLQGKQIVVMGLVNTQSLAWAIGQKAASLGAEVIYTVQSQRHRDVFLRRSFQKEGLEVDDYRMIPCDVTKDEELQAAFADESLQIDGLVHCIGYANPKTCLAEKLSDAPRQDVLLALEISAASLAFAAAAAQPRLKKGASIVALTFASHQVFPHYNWMGVCKAALEATARYLARDMGPHGIRVNCLSAGPQQTLAAGNIPGFDVMSRVWPARSPLGWDVSSRTSVADSAAFLLSDLSAGMTGEVLHVDGGFHMMGMLGPEE